MSSAAAGEMQAAVAQLPPIEGDRKLTIRIGYHFGPVIQSGEDVFGDSVNIAARIAADGDLDPRWFGHPGTTTIYLLSGLVTVLFHLGAGFGLVDRAAGFESFFNEHPTVTYLGGRILSLIFGVATVFLTYVIARRIFNRSTALGAAAFLAVARFT